MAACAPVFEDPSATELVHQIEEPPEAEAILEETGISRLPWHLNTIGAFKHLLRSCCHCHFAFFARGERARYEELIKQAPKCEADCLDWKVPLMA